MKIYTENTVLISEVIKNILSTENNDTTLILYNNRLVGFNSRYFTNHELLKNIEIYSIGNNIKNRKSTRDR